METKIIYPNYEKCVLSTITSILKYYNVNTPYSSLPSLDEKLNKKMEKFIKKFLK